MLVWFKWKVPGSKAITGGSRQPNGPVKVRRGLGESCTRIPTRNHSGGSILAAIMAQFLTAIDTHVRVRVLKFSRHAPDNPGVKILTWPAPGAGPGKRKRTRFPATRGRSITPAETCLARDWHRYLPDRIQSVRALRHRVQLGVLRVAMTDFQVSQVGGMGLEQVEALQQAAGRRGFERADPEGAVLPGTARALPEPKLVPRKAVQRRVGVGEFRKLDAPDVQNGELFQASSESTFRSMYRLTPSTYS